MKKIQIVRRIWSLYRPFQIHFSVVLLLMLILHVIVTILPMIFGSMVTAVQKTDYAALLVAGLLWAGIFTVRMILIYVREWYELRHLDFELSRFVSNVSMTKFFSISMGQHHLGHSMIKRSIISKGEAAANGIIWTCIWEVLPISLGIILPVCFLLVKVPVVGVAVFTIILVHLMYTFKFVSMFLPKLRVLDTNWNRVAKKDGEFTQNCDVVYVNAQEDRVMKECDVARQGLGLEGVPIWVSYIRYFYSGQWVLSLCRGGCYLLGGYLAIKGQISAGMFVTVVWWVDNSLGTLANISHIQRNFAKNLAPINKYFRFLDYQSDVPLPANPVPLENLRGRIEFRHVSFAYKARTVKDSLNDSDSEDGEEVVESKPEMAALNDVSFIIEEGKTHAFVGPSGAGKSTIVALILRAFDAQKGHILIDGVDIRMLDFRELRRNIGLVPQDVSLFDGTMRYNITFGLNGSADKVTDSDLEAVAKLSRISEFSDKLEKGWETTIGERGIKLSGGQRQRVGIARALIKNPQILIFDEATSSLDTENEARIRDSIREASVGKTTIIIAHRLATVRDTDKIFVFDGGRVVGEGTHDELLGKNESYKRLVQNQVIMA